ncbi:B12-binding domain-containing radical SAM protein [Candidatus Electrothrix sp.]|uniref:B12-binding domain-containing radical SAM protein n=1 Tax=Candidatus Electrothrix sp. TaxID=2170559 RepID=UPI004057474D
MRILLIRPPRPPKAITIGEFMFCEPLGLEAVSAVLQEKHQVTILDMMAEQVNIGQYLLEMQPEAVGITALCIDVENVLALARLVKTIDQNIPVVVGGTQAQLVPQAFADPVIDYVMHQTTAEGLHSLFHALATPIKAIPDPDIPGVISVQQGIPKKIRRQKNEYLVPDRSSCQQYRDQYSYFGYKPCALLQTSQGCSQCCSFCLRWRLEGGKEAHQDMEVIFTQIRTIDEPSIMIIDNDFLCSGERLEQLCDFLDQEGIRKNFLCYGSVQSILNNEERVRRFARHGLKAVLVGYESFDPDELASYQKKASVEDNLKVSHLLRQWGIDAWASFILHPNWDHEDFKAFRRSIRQLRPEISSLSPLTPFPGLPAFQQFQDRLLFEPTDYEQWSFGNIAIRPSKMSLRAYYAEVLLTNLQVNFFMNNAFYLIQRFGIKTLLRLSIGGIHLTLRYLAAMWRSG